MVGSNVSGFGFVDDAIEDLAECMNQFLTFHFRFVELEHERIVATIGFEAERELPRSILALPFRAFVIAHFIARQSLGCDSLDQSEHFFDRILPHDLEQR